jgi:streptomycin 6-kinase
MPGEPFENFSTATLARFGDAARAWVAGVQDMIADLGDRWSLQLGEPSSTDDAYVLPADRGGDRLLLEIAYPDGWWPEATKALGAWRGDGVAKLFEHDDRGARLLERLEQIAGTDDETSTIRDVAAIARRLWIAAPEGITTVAVEVRAWASELPQRHVTAGRPFEREMVRRAADLFATLGPTQGERVLLHGDLRLTSLALADDRRVLTGPRPLVGEREFDVASLVRDTPLDLLADVHEGRRRVRERLETLVDELGCNATRLRSWAFATAVDQAVWCAENGDHGGGTALIETARMIDAIEV